MSDEDERVYRWIDRPGGTKEDYWIDVISQDTANGMSDDHWRAASVKWDGCIHYNRYFNLPGPENVGEDECSDYIHICDIDEEIEWLKALKAKAIEHFGNGWPR